LRYRHKAAPARPKDVKVDGACPRLVFDHIRLFEAQRPEARKELERVGRVAVAEISKLDVRTLVRPLECVVQRVFLKFFESIPDRGAVLAGGNAGTG
jgi:hypothetical protein